MKASAAQAVLGKIIAGKPVSAMEHRSSVPANVDAAVRCALEKLPADRFTSAQDFVRALEDEHFRYGELATVGADVGVGPWKRPDDSNDDTRGPPCCPGRLGLAISTSGPRAGCANAGDSDGRRPTRGCRMEAQERQSSR